MLHWCFFIFFFLLTTGSLGAEDSELGVGDLAGGGLAVGDGVHTGLAEALAGEALAAEEVVPKPIVPG